MRCLAFLEGMEKAPGPNRRHSAYIYKLMVESPGRHCQSGREEKNPDLPSVTTRFVYSGTFSVAALESGFTMNPKDHITQAWFNVKESSLQLRLSEFAREVENG